MAPDPSRVAAAPHLATGASAPPRVTVGEWTEETSDRRSRRSSSAVRADTAGDRDPSERRDGPRRMATRSSRSRQGTGQVRRVRGRPPRRSRKARRVHRVVQHVEVWSVFKVALLFVACAYVVLMVAGYLLWQAAEGAGTIDGIEGFMQDSGGYDTYQIFGDVVFRSAAVGGAVLGALAVTVAVLAAVLFNLVSDITGGVRMTVIDEDLIVAPVSARRRVNRRRDVELDAVADESRDPAASTAARPVTNGSTRSRH